MNVILRISVSHFLPCLPFTTPRPVHTSIQSCTEHLTSPPFHIWTSTTHCLLDVCISPPTAQPFLQRPYTPTKTNTQRVKHFHERHFPVFSLLHTSSVTRLRPCTCSSTTVVQVWAPCPDPSIKPSMMSFTIVFNFMSSLNIQ